MLDVSALDLENHCKSRKCQENMNERVSHTTTQDAESPEKNDRNDRQHGLAQTMSIGEEDGGWEGCSCQNY